jgi:GT2 family glycosyltransferase
VSAARHAVVIASTRRPEILADTLTGLSGQTCAPDVIVLCVAEDADLPDDPAQYGPVQVVHSERGLTVQRNTAVASLAPLPELITFIDDDAELASDYFEHLREFMAREQDVVLLTGLVIADGIDAGEIDRDRARALLQDAPTAHTVRDVRSAYGCNMTVRGEVAVREPFDERLKLYGWQEDTDFSVRCGRHGRVVHYYGCRAVHLAVGSGRVRGREFGFAQIVNPFYMWRKGTKTTRELAHDWATYLAANTVKLRDRSRPDRAGRLVGNLLGLREVILHGGRPEAVAQIGRPGRP